MIGLARSEYAVTHNELDVAELYHENTKIAPYEIGADVLGMPEPIEPGIVLARFRLPPCEVTAGMSLEEAIARRSTCRTFDPGASLSLTRLARLIEFACGFTTVFPEAPDLAFHRAVPSGGARYPVEAYPIVLRVDNLPPGVYHYAHTDNSLELLRPGDYRAALAKWTLGQSYVADAGVVLALAGIYERIRPRYGERGYRYTLFEAGHIAQNLCLLATAYGLGALAIGGFVDAILNRLLGLPERTGEPDDGMQTVLYLMAIGVPKT